VQRVRNHAQHWEFHIICTLAMSLTIHPDVVVGIEGPTDQVRTHHVVRARQQEIDFIFPVIIVLTSASASFGHNLPIGNQTLHLLVFVSAVDWLFGAVFVDDGLLVEALGEVSAHLVSDGRVGSDAGEIVDVGQHLLVVIDEQVIGSFEHNRGNFWLFLRLWGWRLRF